MIRVKDLMTEVVATLAAGDTLAQAIALMHRGRVRHLPVVDGEGRLVGLLTHRMVLAAWVSHGDPDHEKPGQVAREVPIEMLMERSPVTIWPEAPASQAARLLEAHKYGCLPVLEDGKLVGIITEADFVRLAARLLEAKEAREGLTPEAA